MDRCIFLKKVFKAGIKDLHSLHNHVACVSIGITTAHVRDHAQTLIPAGIPQNNNKYLEH